MKEDEYPKCWYQDDEGVWNCYVMEFDDHEHLDFDETTFENGLVQVIQQCRICGERDIYYPV